MARVLFIDDHGSFVKDLGRAFRDLGHSVWVATSFPEAAVTAGLRKPDFVVSELRVSGRFIFDFLPGLSEKVPLGRLAVATAYPSVATAVRLIRMGVAAYFTKPVSAAAILAELGRKTASAANECDDTHDWPTLGRTIWEYLNQVYVTAGSLSEAARMLGLDRRSLRRMLGKYPPPR